MRPWAEVADLVSDFDDRQLCYPWRHPDPTIDLLHQQVLRIVEQGQADDHSRVETFRDVWFAAQTAKHGDLVSASEPPLDDVRPVADIPYLTEPWYC